MRPKSKWTVGIGSDHSGADIRVLFLLCIALVSVVAINALDFDEDGLDDSFESQYSGFSTNAYAPTNLVGWWQMDEVSGTNATDRSSNNLPLALIEGGSNTNIAYWTSGLFSNAVQMNGTGRYLQAQSNAVYNLSNFTFSAWVKTTNANATDAPVIARWLDDASHGWQLYVGTNGLLASRFDTTSSPPSEILSGDIYGDTTVITDQTWHHIALTYVASNKLAKIYVDGILEGQTNLTGTFGPNIGEFRLGHQGWNDWFSNRVDEVRIYNRALTADEITHLPETYSDFDGDGYSNLDEQSLSYDPTVPDNLIPVISILSGNGQTEQSDVVLPTALSVTLRHSEGNGAITNFPVTFGVTQGSGKINSTSTNVTVITDAYGIATVNYLLIGSAGSTNLLNASARSGTNTTQVTFSEYVAAVPTLSVTNGLKLWLKADAGITKDATNYVSAWADQSTNGYSAAQSTQAYKPLYISTGINSRASIRFDGSNDFLKASDAGAISTLSFSWFAVTGNVPAKDLYLMGGTGASSPANRAPFLRSITNKFQIGHYIEPATTNFKNESGSNVTSPNILTALVDDSAKTIKGYIKGTNVISTTYSGNTATGTRDFHVGAAPFNNSGNPLAFMEGDISEVVVYNRALSDSERQFVEAYLGAKYNITVPISSPTFSPDGGSYTNAQSVTISAATVGATIRYTTTGVDPSPTDTVIASGSNVLVNASMTLKAKAWRNGLPESQVKSADYVIKVATPTFSPGAGTYTNAQTVAISTTTPGAAIHYTSNGNDPTLNDPVINSGSTLQVNSSLALKARAFLTGSPISDIASAYYDVAGVLAKPEFVPDGGTYTACTIVKILCPTAGTTIHYTTNGEDPTESDPTITSGNTITLSGPRTLKACAFKGGSSPSAIKSADYVLTGMVGKRSQGALVVKADGTVWGWGANSVGQLGTGSTNAITTSPVQATGVSNVVFAAGISHTLALKNDGTIWTWGYNANGELGRGSGTNNPTPATISSFSNVVGVAAGWNHALAVKSDGTVWSWGFNDQGQLGDNSTSTRTTPIQVKGVGAAGFLSNIVSVAAGDKFSAALASDGSVWTWGRDTAGELGNNVSLSNSKTPVQVVGSGGVGYLQDVAAIQAGEKHVTVRLNDGTMWAWGSTLYGRLGNNQSSGTPVDYPVRVNGSAGIGYLDNPGGSHFASTHYHNFVLQTNGQVWAWGYNGYGQLGDATAVNKLAPVPITFLTNVVNMSGGALYSSAILKDGSVVTWGGNVNGEQGNGTNNSNAYYTPTAVSGFMSFQQVSAPAINPNGGTFANSTNVTLSTTPTNAVIRYTIDGSEPNSASFKYTNAVSVAASTLFKAKAFLDGYNPSDTASASFDITSSITFSPDGGNFGSSTNVTVSGPYGWNIYYTKTGADPTQLDTHIASGASVLIDKSMTLKARAFTDGMLPSGIKAANYSLTNSVAIPNFSPDGGIYTNSQSVVVTCITDGATIHYTTSGNDPTTGDPTIASGSSLDVEQPLILKAKAFKDGSTSSDVRSATYLITAGAGRVVGAPYNSFFMTSARDLWGWGKNDHGQVGVGGTPSGTPVRAPVKLTTLTNVVDVAGGDEHSLAVTADGKAWSWGRYTSGQLGTGTNADVSIPAVITSLTNVTQVSAGASHSIGLKSDGTVWSWGANSNGQLGDNTTTQRNTPIQVHGTGDVGYLSNIVAVAGGEYHSVALKSDGTVWTWGSNNYYQLGDGTAAGSRLTPVQVTNLTSVAAISTRAYHTLALKSDASVWAWGKNGESQLGDGTTDNNKNVPVQIAAAPGFIGIGAGQSHSMALRADGTVWVWGENDLGQLGIDSITSTDSPVQLANISNVIGISAGENHNLAMLADGTIQTWGLGTDGQLGNGLDQSISSPISVDNLATSSDDPDGDGLATWLEIQLGSDPFTSDSNGDGISDGIAYRSGLSLTDLDTDGDGLTNAQEALLGTNPFQHDTDNDGVNDLSDAFPLDPNRSTAPSSNPFDTTPPTITLDEPTNATLL